ncbi:MAG TPA: hypothetical protein VEI01_08275 [Terriglobales bacterium]|nr:hypothetical protein [Terriglobales bacterium]
MQRYVTGRLTSIALAFGLGCLSTYAQTVTASMWIAGDPYGLAVNPNTNEIYVANGTDNVPVIGGATKLPWYVDNHRSRADQENMG